jgi:hypothetical protein
MTGPYKGSCLCGSITFEVDDFIAQTGNCHCSMCRKFHGAAFATLGEARRDCFRWVSGEAMLKDYTAANGTVRTFCNNCGSSLMFFSPAAAADLVEIALGCFDDEVPVKPDAHIYLGSGVEWAAPGDDLPRYEAGRDSSRIS